MAQEPIDDLIDAEPSKRMLNPCPLDVAEPGDTVQMIFNEPVCPANSVSE
jgi:hypothetical protein